MQRSRNVLLTAMSLTVILVMLYAVYIVGIAFVYVDADNRFNPILQGILVSVAALLLLSGIRQSKLLLAWLGGIGLLVLSVLFVFGIGALLMPISGLLIIGLALLTWFSFSHVGN